MDPLSSTPQIHFGRVPLKELSPFATARNRFNRFTSPSTSSIGDSVKITGPKPFLSDRESVGSASPSPNKLKRKRSSSSVKEGSDQTGMLSRIIKKTKTSKPKKEALEGRISLIKRQQANDKKGLDYNLSQPAGTRVWDNAGGRHLYTGTKEYENFVNHQYKEVFRSQNAEIAQKKEKLEKFDNGFLNRINPFSSQRSLDDSSINNRGRSRNRTEDTSRRSRSAPIDTTYSPTRTLGHYSDSTYSSSNETLSDMGEQRYRRGRSPFSDSAYSSSSESLSGNRSQRSRSSSIDSSSSNPSFPSSAQNLSNQNYAFWKAPLLWTESELQSAGARKIPRVLGYSGREGSTILPAFNSKKDALKLRLPTRSVRQKIAATATLPRMPKYLEKQYKANGRKTVPFMAFDIKGSKFNGLSPDEALKKGIMYAPFMATKPGNTRVYCFPPSIANTDEGVNALHRLNSKSESDFHHSARFPQGLRTDS